MVDIFVVLMLAGAGDELQGIKRGVLGDRRPDRGQQGRRRQRQAGPDGGGRLPAGDPPDDPGVEELDGSGADLLGADQ
jgi:hypothetical protein